MSKLNPCPDCGQEPELTDSIVFVVAYCQKCREDGNVIISKTVNSTTNAWNTATSDTQSVSTEKTLRDEFAMAAYIDKPMIVTILKENGVEDFSYQDFAELEARMRYVFADAMLKERNK